MDSEQRTNHNSSAPENPSRQPKADLSKLSVEELQEHIEELEDMIRREQQQQEMERKAHNLQLLKLANQAPRCSHVKANGATCRAPAMNGSNLFCWFHNRALHEEDGPRMKVRLLEDRQSIQHTVKQVMEQLVFGRINPSTASVLFRGVQIVSATLKPKRVQAPRALRKPIGDEECLDSEKNVNDKSEEELDAELAQLESEIEELKRVLASAPEYPPSDTGSTP